MIGIDRLLSKTEQEHNSLKNVADETKYLVFDHILQYVSENLTTDRRHRGKSAMLLLLPQREQDPNYQNFINIPVVCGILQTPLDVVHNGNISLNGPVVEFSSE